MRKLLCCFIIALSCLGLEAAGQLGLAEKGLRSLLIQEEGLLSRMSRAPLKERLLIKDQLEVLQERIQQQALLLGMALQTALPTQVKGENLVSVPNWLPEVRESRPMTWPNDDPTSLTWAPRWSLNLGRRIQALKRRDVAYHRDREGMESGEKRLDDVFSRSVNASRSDLSGASTGFDDGLPRYHHRVLASHRVSFPVPTSHREGKWYLWEKVQGEVWRKILTGEGDQNIGRTFERDVELLYAFTVVEHQPTNHTGDYHFTLDTRPPEVETLDIKKGSYGLLQISWRFVDDHMSRHPVTLNLLKKDGTVLSTEGVLPVSGIYVLTKEQESLAWLATIEARDEAGNITHRNLYLR